MNEILKFGYISLMSAVLVITFFSSFFELRVWMICSVSLSFAIPLITSLLGNKKKYKQEFGWKYVIMDGELILVVLVLAADMVGNLAVEINNATNNDILRENLLIYLCGLVAFGLIMTLIYGMTIKDMNYLLILRENNRTQFDEICNSQSLLILILTFLMLSFLIFCKTQLP